MHSFAWINGQCQKVQPPSQSSQAASQLIHSPMWNQQSRIADYSHQQRTLNQGIRPPQRSHCNFRDGAYSNRQMSNWQTSAVPHQTVSSQQPARGETNDLKMLHGNVQNSFLKTQNVNLVSNGLQVATQQDFHMNSGIINPSSHIPPNTIYRQQDMLAQWNQQCTGLGQQSAWMQVVSDPQKFCILKTLLQNVNAESIKPISTCTTTATSLPHEQAVSTSNSMSTIAHNRLSAHNQYFTQNGPKHELSPLIHPPSYKMAISQSLRNNSSTKNSSSPEQTLHVSTMTQKTRQHAIHLNSTQNNGQEAACRFASKTNELVDETQEQTCRRQMIARIEADLRNSFTLPRNNSSPYRGKQFVSAVRMTGPNQNNQPAKLTVTESYNSNASQSFLLNSGPSLPKTTHSVMSRTLDSLNAPQQNPVPNAFFVTLARDGCGEIREPNDNGYNTANAVFTQNSNVPKGNMFGSLSDSSPSMKWPENISLHTSKTKSSVENSHEMPEKLKMVSTVKANDNSIHSSPGRTGTRAVAVVQPLSQEGNHAAGSNVSSEIINQSADKNVIHSAASCNGTVVSSSDSTGHEDKQIFADNTESDVSIDMQVDHYGTPTTQQSVSPEVQVNQSGKEDKSENQTDPEILKLSSVPTIPWTIDTLAKLIQDEEEAQMKLNKNFTMSNTATKLLSMFWGGNVKNLTGSVKSRWCHYLMTHIRGFCIEHVTSDSVVLSQVKGGFEKQLQSFHILKDNEVYSNPPYKSSWLNVNEQLDDIDKEFGFPWSLRHHVHMPESHSQPDQGCTVNSIPAQTASEVPNNVQSQSALEPVDSGEESLQNSTVGDASAQVASPNETGTVDSSASDPCYSFEIKVLPPEEAKVIFEQIQSKMEQGQYMECQPKKVINSSMEDELPEAIDATPNVSELEKGSDIEEVCCFSRWVEINLGSNRLSLTPCHCKNKQGLTNCTDNRDKEEMAGQKENDLTEISKSHMEGENEAKGGEVINNQIMTDRRSKLCNDTNFLTENSHKCPTYSDKEPRDISQMSLNRNQLSIPHINENEDKGLSSSNTENRFDPELESTGCTQSCASVSSDKDIEILPRSEREVATHKSDLEENCGQAQFTSTYVETEEQQPQITAAFSLSGNHETVERKHKRLSSHDRYFPVQSIKRKPPFDMDSLPSAVNLREVTDKTENEPLASNGKTVQLVLFGSTPKEMCSVIGSRKRHNSSPGMVSDELQMPPQVLSVTLSPLRRKPSESIAVGEHSVERRHEQWRRNFQPTKSRYGSKDKTQSIFSSLSDMSLKRTGTVNPTNTEKLPIASKMGIWSLNRNAKRCLSLKKRVSFSDRLKRREQMIKQDAVIPKQPADQERSYGENESPLQEDTVLRFSVLPNTFNFKNGCNERKEANDPVPNKPVLVKGKHKGSSKTAMGGKGKWCPSNPEKKYCAPRKTPVPKTSGLFQEFQKKYMETQPSIDE